MSINNNKCIIKLIGILMLTSLMLKVQAMSQDTRLCEFKDVDIKSNNIYKKILAKLSPTEQSILIKSQRAWITFRDLDCEWAFPDEPLSCLIRRTENRTQELIDTYTYDIENRYTSKK